jgi:RIO kinase 1
MPRLTLKQLPADLDDLDQLDPALRALPTGKRRRPPRTRSNVDVQRDLTLQYASQNAVSDRMGAESVFRPTFLSSKHEREWILNYLGHFYDDKVITDVLSRVKGGKEANVYCCAAHPATGLDLIAGKVYRPRAFRHLRNDSRYRQGRAHLDSLGKTIRDERMLRAIRKKTDTGQEAVHVSWIEHEFRTLELLHRAGADVPRPIAHDNSTIVMEYFGDAQTPAPLLQDVALDRAEAQALFQRLIRNVELMLGHGRIHADLSAFNVLYWEGDIRLIDFPQAVSPHENPEALDIFRRDVTRLCQYFHRQGVAADPRRLAAELWARHVPPAVEPLDLFLENEDKLS